MTGYDAATVEACAKVVDALAKYGTGEHDRSVASAIRALPIAPPAPIVTVGDVADAVRAVWGHRPCEGDAKVVDFLNEALARRAAPAVDQAELDRLREAATALIADVRVRHPGEDLRCPHMIALDAALNREGIA